MLQKLKDKLLVAAVDAKLRSLLTPEKVHEYINDALDLLFSGFGQTGLGAELLKELQARLDTDEMSAVLSARLLHILVG